MCRPMSATYFFPYHHDAPGDQNQAPTDDRNAFSLLYSATIMYNLHWMCKP